MKRWITYGVLLTASLVLIALIVAPIWKPLLVALVAAGAFSRWHDRVAGWVGGRRSLSAVLFTFVVIVAILIPIAALVTALIPELIDATAAIQHAVQTKTVVSSLPEPLEGWLRRGLALLPSGGQQLASMAAAGKSLAASALGALASTARFGFNAAMFVIALFFFFAQGHELVRWVVKISPLRERSTELLLRRFRQSAIAVLGSTVASAAAQAVFSGIGFWIAPLPAPLLLGALTFFMAFVPSVGVAAVGIPATALTLALGHPGWAVFVFVWCVLIAGVLDNFIKPRLIKGSAELSGGAVFFALIGGIAFFGPIGLIVGPLALSLFQTLVEIGREELASSTPSTAVIAEPGPEL